MAPTFYNFVIRVLMVATLAISLASCEATPENTVPLSKPLVVGGTPVSDSPLVAEVQKALKNNAQTMLLRVQVLSIDDVIILKGNVNSEQMIQVAEEVAARVAGVRVVTNNLYVVN